MRKMCGGLETVAWRDKYARAGECIAHRSRITAIQAPGKGDVPPQGRTQPNLLCCLSMNSSSSARFVRVTSPSAQESPAGERAHARAMASVIGDPETVK